MEFGHKKYDRMNLRAYVTDFLVRHHKSNFVWELPYNDAVKIEGYLRIGWLPNMLVAQAAEVGQPEIILIETNESKIVTSYSLTNDQFTLIFASVDLPGLNVPLR